VYAGYILIPIFLSIYVLLFFRKDDSTAKQFFLFVAIALTVYYLLATTVHPWYILAVLFFSVLSGRTFGIIWSGLVFLSYSAYSGSGSSIYYSMITIEYAVLFIYLFLEWRNKAFNIQVISSQH
jgi:hypothetical protein